MITNFDSLLLQIRSARNLSQLKIAHNSAHAVLEVWVNAGAISADDFHEKTQQAQHVYNNQLIDFTKSPISNFIGLTYKKVNQVKS